MATNFCYREVALNNLVSEDWVQVEIKGGSQSTLQEIKCEEKSGGYSYKNPRGGKNRNRFIYWRTYADTLEVSEISLDLNLQYNNVRFRFVDSAVVAVQFEEHGAYVSMLVVSIDCLHYFKFPQDSAKSTHARRTNLVFGNDQPAYSIFCNVKSRENQIGESVSYAAYNFSEQTAGAVQGTPQSAACAMRGDETALFALAHQSTITLYIMNCLSGKTQVYSLNEGHSLVPRFLVNLKDAIVSSKTDAASFIASLVFDRRDDNVYIVALHHNHTLRIWSTTSMQLVGSFSQLREYDEQRNQSLFLGQSNVLRRINDVGLFCAFLADAEFSEFLVFELSYEADDKHQWAINCYPSVAAPPLTLVDFDASETVIWSLWSDVEGAYSMLNFPMRMIDESEYNWISAALEPPPDRSRVNLDDCRDIREAYTSYILTSGKFDLRSIVKALNMFRRGSERTDFKHLTLAKLKASIYRAVEHETQSEFKSHVIDDDAYFEAAKRHWERFYVCCEQYHLKTVQPLSLVMLHEMNSVCIVRKQSFTLLRPCELMERLILVGGRVQLASFASSYFDGDMERAENFRQLMTLLAEIDNLIPEDFKIVLDRNIYQLENVDVLIAELSSLMLQQNPDIAELIFDHLKHLTHDKFSAVETLLNLLALDERPDIDETVFSTEMRKHETLFVSECGRLLLGETVKQTAMMWYAICRSMLIVEEIIISGTLQGIRAEQVSDIRWRYVPKTKEIFLTNFVRIWIAETGVNLSEQITTTEPPAGCGPKKMDALPRIKKIEAHNEIVRSITDVAGVGIFPAVSLLHMFLRFKGLHCGLALLTKTCESRSQGTGFEDTLLPLSQTIHTLITPTSCNIIFEKWLFSTCQYVHMQGYVRLLSKWCVPNAHTRNYMLAVSLLDCDDVKKALDILLECAKGLQTDHCLKAYVLGELFDQNTSNSAINALPQASKDLTNYYMHIINLFDQYEAYEAVIRVAEVAIEVSKGTPVLPMFQSIVFNNHLKLEHYDEAYDSMVANADDSRKNICLRQLIKTLFDQRRLDLLLKFSYKGLEFDFENIVQTHARSEVISKNIVYDFLYAYYMKVKNMTKASAAMFEQAMRFKLEGTTIEDNLKRRDSLLAGLNTMHLLQPDYQYLVRPDLTKECMNTNNDEEELIVVGIEHFNREWLLSDALHTLSQKGKDITTLMGSRPTDIVNILATCKLFTQALKLAKSFKVSLLPTFEQLTAACVQPSVADKRGNVNWQWLKENDVSNLPHFAQQADLAWALLQQLVEEYEVEDTTTVRKAVLNQLLSLEVFIPHWLYLQYKRDNYRELLNLLVKHRRLLEASDLTKELIDGDLRELNGEVKTPSALPFLLPVQPVVRLIEGLKLCSKDHDYKLAYDSLLEYTYKYLEITKNHRQRANEIIPYQVLRLKK